MKLSSTEVTNSVNTTDKEEASIMKVSQGVERGTLAHDKIKRKDSIIEVPISRRRSSSNYQNHKLRNTTVIPGLVSSYSSSSPINLSTTSKARQRRERRLSSITGHNDSNDNIIRIGEYDNARYWTKLVYSLEVIAFPFIPLFYRWFELHSQPKFLMCAGGLSTVIYVYYFIYNTGIVMAEPGAIATYVIVQTMVAILYPLSSIGAFAIVGRSAYFRVHDPTNNDHNNNIQQHHQLRDLSSSPISATRLISRRHSNSGLSAEERLGRTLARFYGIYFGFYAGAGIILIIFGVIIQSQAHSLNLGEYTTLAFWSLGMIALIGSFSYLGIPPCPRSDVIPGTPTPCVSPWKTLLLPFANNRFRPYAILLILAGMVEAYSYIDFVLYISTPRIGPKSSGVVTGFALFVDGVISFLLGLSVYKGYFNIKAVLVFGIISLILALVYSIILSAATVSNITHLTGWVYLGTLNFTRSASEDGIDDWIQVNKVEIYHYLIVALSIILIGMGLMPFKAHLPSAIHQIYQPTPYHLQVSSHIKGLRAFGFILQSIIDVIINKINGQHPQINNIIAAIILMVISIISFLPLSTVWLLDIYRTKPSQ